MEKSGNLKSEHNKSTLRSITRLVIGGVEGGLKGLQNRINEWESEITENERPEQITRTDAPTDAVRLQSAYLPTELLLTAGIRTSDHIDSSNERITITPNQIQFPLEQGTFRHTLIGLIFTTQDGLLAGLQALGKLERDVYTFGSPFFKPLEKVTNRPIFSSARNRFDRYVERGQTEVDRLTALGIVEERRSLKLAERAFYQSIDGSLDYLAQNQGLQELVQIQSTTLATEVVYEVRERTVSADNLAEGLVRHLFRRTPREDLPSPSPEVLNSAKGTGLVGRKPKNE